MLLCKSTKMCVCVCARTRLKRQHCKSIANTSWNFFKILIFNINLCFYRVNLSDSGDQIKTPIKTEGSWSLPSVNPTTPCTPDKPLLEHSVSIVNLVKASPHEVTHKPMLDLYIRLYSACLDGQSQLWVLCSDAFMLVPVTGSSQLIL